AHPRDLPSFPTRRSSDLATSKDIGYDDYQGLDVAGKVVLVLRQVPRMNNPHVPFEGRTSAHHAALATKLENAERRKAAGVLFVRSEEHTSELQSLTNLVS